MNTRPDPGASGQPGRSIAKLHRPATIVAGFAAALLVLTMLPRWWCGRDAGAWYAGDPAIVQRLAEEMLAQEASDDRQRTDRPGREQTGPWGLLVHQMTALGLAQVCLAHPQWRGRYGPAVTRAAAKSLLPEMRSQFTQGWNGEDGIASLDGPHGHAYLGWPALALGLARLVDSGFPPALSKQHDALIVSLERRLLAAPAALLETLPGEAYPTDMAAVAAAIAIHGRATGSDHTAALAHWARQTREVQTDEKTGLVWQRMGADGRAHDAPRASGTALAAYFAGFADRKLARELADGALRQERSFLGFSAIHEYGEGYDGAGDVDSGPVILGTSVAATGFALAPARAFGHRDAFIRMFRTANLFGLPLTDGSRIRFATGGAVGNALLLAFLTSGPELAP